MANFCGKCGTRLDKTTGLCPKCNKLPNPRKPWLIILIVALIVCLLITAFTFYIKQKNASEQPNENTNMEDAFSSDENSAEETDFIKTEQIIWTYLEGTNQTDNSEVLRIAVDATPLDIKMQGYPQKISHNLTGDIGCVIDGANTLYVIDGKTVTEVAKDVTDCVLSASGEVLAYTDTRDTLMLYSIVTGAKAEIAQNVDKASGFVISPDGNSIAYATSDENTENTSSLSMYVYSRGKTVKMGKNQIPIGISNGARQIYYVVSPDKNLYSPCSLYVGNMQEDNRLLVKSEMMLDGLCFNADQTQLLFVSDGNYYLCVEGGEAVQLTSDGTPMLCLNLVAPKSSASGSIKSWNRFEGSIVYRIYPINNFSGHYYTEYPTRRLLYLDMNLKLVDLGNGQETGSVALSDNADILLYSLKTGTGNDLYRMDTTEASVPELLAENIWYGVLSPDGDAVYYIDQNDTLWYKNGQVKPKQVANDIQFCNITHDGYAVFGTFGSQDENNFGMLYASKDGGEKQNLFSDFYDRLFTYPSFTLVYTNYSSGSNTYDIYAAVDGMDFVRIVEGAKYEEIY